MTEEGRQGGKHYHSIRQVLSVCGTTAGAEGLQWRWLSLSEDADIQRLRKTSSEVWMGIQRLYRSLFCLWRLLFWGFFCSLRLILCLKLVTMSGATSDQLHRSTLSVYVVSLLCPLVFYIWNCCSTVFSGVFVCISLCLCVFVFYCRTWWSTSILACRSSSL